MTASSPIFADDCMSTCATATCLVVGQIAQPGDQVLIYLPGDASVVSVQIKDIGEGTLGFQMTANGVDWVSAEMFVQPGDDPVSQTTTNGLWRGSVAGMSQFRVISDLAYTGSMAEVTLRVSPADLFVGEGEPTPEVPAADVLRANIGAVATGDYIIIPGVADRAIRVHRVVLSASELVQVSFMSANTPINSYHSGPQTLDTMLLDFDAVYPWYVGLVGKDFMIQLRLADGSGTPPDEEPVIMGGTIWYSLSPLPVVLP